MMKIRLILIHGVAAVLVGVSCSKQDPVTTHPPEESGEGETIVSGEDEAPEAKPKRSLTDGTGKAEAKRNEDLLAALEAENEKRLEEARKRREQERRDRAAGARKRFVGRTLPSIVTKDKREFNNASVTGVDELGITIMHASGVASINYPDLPADLQRQLHYHKADYERALEDSKVSASTETASSSTADSESGSSRSPTPPAKVQSPTPPAETTIDTAAAVEMPDFRTLLEAAQGEVKRARLELSEARIRIREMYRTFTSGVQSRTDRQKVMAMTGQVEKLRREQAKWEAESYVMSLAVLVRPSDYRKVRPALEKLRAAQLAAEYAKADEDSASDRIGWLQALEDGSSLKSTTSAAQIKKAEDALKRAKLLRAEKETEARLAKVAFERASRER